MTAPSGADKLIELSRIAGGLAHEIRNPLSTVNINLQLLDEDLGRPQLNGDVVRRTRARIGVLRHEVKRLADILDEFLRFAHLPRLELAELDVNQVVAEVVRFFTPEARQHRITILTSYAPLPRCIADKNLLKQAVLNLLINAQQAMAAGGDLMVRTSPAALDGEGDSVRISVADTGHGIASDVLPHIFEPYFSTKRQGSGLGLSTVKRIVEEHGGRIRVHSQVQQGACFEIMLPLSGPQAPRQAAGAAEGGAGDGTARRGIGG